MPFAFVLLALGGLLVYSSLKDTSVTDILNGVVGDPLGSNEGAGDLGPIGTPLAADLAAGTVPLLSSTPGGNMPVGVSTPKRKWNPSGKPVANWIVSELDWAAAHGWGGFITSGYRDPNQVVSNSSGIVAAQGTSNHSKTTYPGGAIDVGDPNARAQGEALARVLASKPGGSRLKWGSGIGDYGHFSGTGR